MNGSWTSKVVQAAVSAAVLVALVPVYAQTGPQQEERPVVSSATLREAFSISGIVLDPSGAVVVGATIFIRGQRGDLQQSAQSDSAGEFRFTGLPEGRYQIHVEQLGFKPYETRLRLQGRRDRQLRIVLSIANFEQRITVDSSEGQISTEARENLDAIRLDSRALEGLPILGEDVVGALSQLAGALGAGGVEVIVDGMPGAPPGLSASAIQEIRINENPYSAEFARPGRARIEIITKSGSAALHGSLFFGFRDYRLDARNAFAAERPPEQHRQVEGSLSGPIGNNEKTTFVFTASRKDDEFQPLIYALAPQGLVRRSFANPEGSAYLSAQITRQIRKNPLSIRYTVFDWSDRGEGVGGFSLPETAMDSASRYHQLYTSYRETPTRSLLNDLLIRVQWGQTSTRSRRPDVTKIVVADAFAGGGAQVQRNDTDARLELTDVLSWSHGRHFVKTGVNLPALSRRSSDDRSNFDGTFYFSSLDDFVRGTPFSFVRQQGDGHLIFWHKEAGLFLQDDIRIRSGLSMGLGLRYDWQNYLSHHNNLGPRVSFAFAPGHQRRTVLRGGAGLFYSMTGPGPIADTLRFSGHGLRQFVLSNPGYPDPLSLGGSFSAPPTSLVRFDPHIRSPYVIQYSLGVERQLQKSLTWSATYRGTRGIKLFRSRDINAPLPPLYLARPDPSIGVFRQIESSGHLESHAVETTLRGKLSRYFNAMVVYALQRTYDNTNGINSLPADNYDLSGEWSRAGYDARHFLYLYGTLDAGKFFQAGVVFSANSGRPYSITTGRDDNQDGFANDRPAGVRRNSMQGPGSATLDLRWLRNLFGRSQGRRATVSLDAFNVLNRVNYGAPSGNLSSPFFGRFVRAGSARRLQASLSFRF